MKPCRSAYPCLFCYTKNMKVLSGKFTKIRTILQKAAVFAIIIKSAWIQAVFAATQQGEIPNPISGADSLETVIASVADAASTIALVLAPVFIVVAGLQFLFAGESEQKISQAKKTLWWTLIGTAIVVGASILTNAVINTIEGL